MCYVIITGRSLAWLLISLAAFMLIITGIVTPKWLLGQPIITNENNITGFFIPTVGLSNRCIRKAQDGNSCTPFSFYGLTTDSTIYPTPWKAAMFFLSLCAAIQFSTVLAGIFACCVQSVFKKSVISLAGATQSLGGLFGVVGLLLYPWGWGSQKVKRLCGENSEPYLPGDCSLGWAFFVAATGVAQIFLASALSKSADKAANSDKVQFQMDDGKQLICIA
ncbi:PREDICTED: lipoma HMGIC fusion partner-like 2 protein [Papilio xuthus]|uniref:Lipoma HMGIC fusion partner-like 2 protein n=1 Tax=Papilio xuthus TaxID=66420 RepID=A0A194PV01_PAPXU|nr:PREDICTED: lipoma HMGIC fusion partner-like 2 protein [Papilio xuthus]KPI96574.1 Lipoma HMGIC fusion partner-like 2 protein [Papilio xuthus]